MLKDSRGKLVYVTEAREKINNKEQKVLKFNEIDVEKPISDEHIKNRIEDIIKAREGLIDIS